jgi:hypothetical protein
MTTRGGRRIIAPIPQEAFTLQEAARLRQERREQTAAEPLRQERREQTAAEPSDDYPTSSEEDPDDLVDREGDDTLVLDVLKSIPGTQTLDEDDDADEPKDLGGCRFGHMVDPPPGSDTSPNRRGVVGSCPCPGNPNIPGSPEALAPAVLSRAHYAHSIRSH